RSRTGCWTCRSRRKKCDEGRPHCSRCLTGGMNCHGYGKSPMEKGNGARERAESRKIKIMTVDSMRRRELLNRQLEEYHHPLQVTLNGSRNKNSNATNAQSRQTEGSINANPMTEFATSPRLMLLLHYLQNVYHWQFRFHPGQSFPSPKDWLLRLILQNQTVYLAVLALSASHLSLVHRPRISNMTGMGEDDVASRYNLAINGLLSSLQQSQYGCQSLRDDKLNVDILLCIIMLMFISYQFLDGESRDWRIHLQAATSILQQYITDSNLQRGRHPEEANDDIGDILNAISASSNERDLNSGNNVVITSAIGLVMWSNILSSFNSLTDVSEPSNISPELCEQYIYFLQTKGTRVNFEEITGCQSWVVISILSIYSLRDWKISAEASRSLSFWDLMKRAGKIRTTLEDGIRASGQGQAEPLDFLLAQFRVSDRHAIDKQTITYVFALAAGILLEIVVSGSYSNLKEVERQVERTIDALKSLPGPSLLQYLAWPICIAGCMAQPQHYDFFTDLLEIGTRSEPGVLLNVGKVIQTCWALRERNQNKCGVDWSDALRNLQI
ncbi:fungal-specific transcription factor domain-containing protein, partial [Xylogone sp. PMI_703]